MKYIIHFTREFSVIEKILETSSLKLTYSGEIFQLGIQKISSAAHPMVCFSEYSLAELQERTITYGSYGIAFSREWVKKKKIHPVLYIDKNSIVAKSLAGLLRARRNKLKDMPDALKMQIMTIKCFTKNIVGYNSYFDKHNFNFREEQEWRFVPQKVQIGNGLISQGLKKFLEKKKSYNDKLIAFPLKFDIDDIEYVFVKTHKEQQIIRDKFNISKNKLLISDWK